MKKKLIVVIVASLIMITISYLHSDMKTRCKDQSVAGGQCCGACFCIGVIGGDGPDPCSFFCTTEEGEISECNASSGELWFRCYPYYN